MAFSIVEQLESADGLLSTGKVAKIYGLSKPTVIRRTRTGEIPAVDLGFGSDFHYDPKQLLEELLARNPFMRRCSLKDRPQTPTRRRVRRAAGK